MQKVRKQYAYVMFRLAISLFSYFLLFSIDQKIFVYSGIQILDTQNPERPENWNFSFRFSNWENICILIWFSDTIWITGRYSDAIWKLEKMVWFLDTNQSWQQNRLVQFEYLSCMVFRGKIHQGWMSTIFFFEWHFSNHKLY